MDDGLPVDGLPASGFPVSLTQSPLSGSYLGRGGCTRDKKKAKKKTENVKLKSFSEKRRIERLDVLT
jgi:hypothetical protein